MLPAVKLSILMPVCNEMTTTDGTQELYYSFEKDARVVICDADLEYSPAEIPSLVARVIAGDAEVVYGARGSCPVRACAPSGTSAPRLRRAAAGREPDAWFRRWAAVVFA